MATTSIHIDRPTYKRLKGLVEREKSSLDTIINKLIDLYEEQEFHKAVADSYARLRQDPEAWAEFQRELEEWDITLMDGLENEPPYNDDADE